MNATASTVDIDQLKIEKIEKIEKAEAKISSKNISSPDGIPPEVVKVILNKEQNTVSDSA